MTLRGVRSRACARGWRVVALCVAALIAIAFTPLSALAGLERYEYDPLGRLVRMIDDQGRLTEYLYDAAGNILEVRSGGTASAPTVTGISPSSLRRGSSAAVIIDGTNLTNIEVLPADPALQVSGVGATATRLSFDLSVGATASLGASSIVLRNAVGQTTVSIGVLPALPVLAVVPTPLAIPPDNLPHSFTVTLDHADTIDHTVAVASDQPTIAGISPASAVIAAGQTQASFQVTGKLGGQTVIRLTSPTLAAAAVPVFVTAEFRGINTAYAPIVGVDLAGTAGGGGTPTSLFSKPVGLLFGSVWVDTAPRLVVVGSSVTLALTGYALPADLSVAVSPPDGITVGTPVVNGAGTQATVTLAAAADAAVSVRRLVVQGGGRSYVAAQPGADRVAVANPQPEILSIAPIFGTAGTTINPFVVRGRNLFDAQTLGFSGGGIVAGAQPQVNAQGTELTTSIEISPVAAPGVRTVTAITPAGSSSATASSANAFSVVQNVGDTFANLVSPLVGVDLAGSVVPGGQSASLVSPLVGVSVGAVVNAVAPATGATGQSLTLVLSGRGLGAASAISLSPPDGLTLGAPVVAPDGTSVSIPLTVAGDAPLGMRRIRLAAGSAAIPFAAANGDRFSVTAPVPELASVDPIVIQVGSTVGLTLRGRNLQGVTQIRLTPSDGIAVGTPSVNAAGDIVTVLVSVDATAQIGNRVVSAVTPAGESSTVAGPTNRVSLSSTAGTTYPSIVSPAVGVEFASVTPPSPGSLSLFSSPVGVELATVTPPASATYGLNSPLVGIALGPVATRVEPLGFNAGESGSVIVRGFGLPADALLAFTPAAGIALTGAPLVAGDGSSITQSIAVAADAPAQLRSVALGTAAGPIRFAAPAAAVLAIGPGMPEVVSLTPILARQGETVSLSIRGRNLSNVVGIVAEPAGGLIFDTQPTVAADGSQIDLRIGVATDAALGGRVIRVVTRSGTSTPVASPANTFTVYPP